jgi:hypothetical protein
MRSLAFVIAATGCGPSLHALAEHRHYREAICGAHDGSSDDRREVGAALDADAEIAVHAHAITTRQLAGVVGDAAEPIAERTRFVRVEVQTNALPVDGLEVATQLDDGYTPIASPVDWDALARTTSESLPRKRTTTTSVTGGNVLRVLGAIATAGLAPLGAAVIGHPFTFDERTIEVDAPDDDYARVAPHAHALFHAMEGGCGPTGPMLSRQAIGTRCTWFFAMDRGLRAPAEIRLTIRYRAAREVGEHPGQPPCEVERVQRISLGRTGELDATFEREFGSRMHTLAELHAHAE